VIFRTRRKRPLPPIFGASRSRITDSSIGVISRAWSRQQHHHGLVPLQPQAGRRPVGVCEHRGAARHHRLTPVISGIVMAAPGEPVANPFDDLPVDVERRLEHPRKPRRA